MLEIVWLAEQKINSKASNMQMVIKNAKMQKKSKNREAVIRLQGKKNTQMQNAKCKKKTQIQKSPKNLQTKHCPLTKHKNLFIRLDSCNETFNRKRDKPPEISQQNNFEMRKF